MDDMAVYIKKNLIKSIKKQLTNLSLTKLPDKKTTTK